MRSVRLLVAVPLACAACTVTGLGNYDVQPCPSQTGGTTHSFGAGTIAANPDFTFTSASGTGAIGTFVSATASNAPCVQALNSRGPLVASSCAFFDGMMGAGTTLGPRQPWAVPLGPAGSAVAAVATSGVMCLGQVVFEYVGPTGAAPDAFQGQAGVCSPTGAALPSLAPLDASGTPALVAWYQTSIDSRTDPLQSCTGMPPSVPAAKAEPLVVAKVINATTTPSIVTAMPVLVTMQSISIRPPATLSVGSEVVLAAPDGNDVGVWTLDASLTVPQPTTIPGLAGARAVSIAADKPDGTGNFAVVAEIGCEPQSIMLAIGRPQGGFSKTTMVAKGTNALIQPTVAWVQASPAVPEGSWLVSWIFVNGKSTHAQAMRFDANGAAIGAMIDLPGVTATAAIAQSDGTLLGYEPGSGSIATVSLGCAD